MTKSVLTGTLAVHVMHSDWSIEISNLFLEFISLSHANEHHRCNFVLFDEKSEDLDSLYSGLLELAELFDHA